MHVETFFARNLGDLIRVRTAMPDRLMRRLPRPDTEEATEQREATSSGRSWREGPHPRETADRRPWHGH